jgi:hypothetical protein
MPPPGEIVHQNVYAKAMELVRQAELDKQRQIDDQGFREFGHYPCLPGNSKSSSSAYGHLLQSSHYSHAQKEKEQNEEKKNKEKRRRNDPESDAPIRKLTDSFTSLLSIDKTFAEEKVSVDDLAKQQDVPCYNLQMADWFEEQDKLEEEEEIQRKRIRTRYEISTDPTRDQRYNGGDERLRKLRSLFNSFGLAPSVDQKCFLTWFTRACLPIIYKDEFQSSYDRIMRENDIDKIDQEVLVMTPRRFGKTTIVSLFVASLLLSVPGIKIAVFSTGRRASGSLTKLVRSFLKFIPGAQERVVESNMERLSIAAKPLPAGCGIGSQVARDMAIDQTTSTLYSYPGDAKGKIDTTHLVFVFLAPTHRFLSSSSSSLKATHVIFFFFIIILFLFIIE